MNHFKKGLEKIKQQQQVLAILVFGLAAAVAWIAVTLITSQQQSGISAELKKMAEPLTPSIDQTVLQGIVEQRIYSEEDLADFPIYRVVQSEATGEEVVLRLGEEIELNTEEEEVNLSQLNESTQSTTVVEIESGSAEQQ